MKVLLHICCGPCSIMPIKVLLDAGHEVTGYFYNPNIHPLSEYLRRRDSALEVASRYGIELRCATDEADYNLSAWLLRSGELTRKSAGELVSSEKMEEAELAVESLNLPGQPVNKKAKIRPTSKRCVVCWNDRLSRAWQKANDWRFEAFTSSLLYSRHQNHQMMAHMAAKLASGRICSSADTSSGASEDGPAFLYHDFRKYWQDGINISKDWGIYRQQYCGCIFSESDRYCNELEKSNSTLQADQQPEPTEIPN